MFTRFSTFVMVYFFCMSASAAVISTTYAGGNGNEGAMFDLTVMSNDIVITGADLNFSDPGSTNVEVYIRQGGYAGFEQNAGAWTLMSSTALASVSPTGQATFVDLTDILLSANTTYGVYFVSTNYEVDLEYTDGSNSYSNADLSLNLGAGINEHFDSIYSPRTWNGSLYYDVQGAVAQVPAPSSLLLIFAGLLGFAVRRQFTS